MHFSQIKVSDLILVDEEGLVVEGSEPVNTPAFSIHSAIHRARPDVHAACHAHSVHGKAFSAFGRPLEMITQDALRFYQSHAVYDNFRGVVVGREEADNIARALGSTNKAAILQNHGLLTVGASVDEAAFWSSASSAPVKPSYSPMLPPLPATRRSSSATRRLPTPSARLAGLRRVGSPSSRTTMSNWLKPGGLS